MVKDQKGPEAQPELTLVQRISHTEERMSLNRRRLSSTIQSVNEELVGIDEHGHVVPDHELIPRNRAEEVVDHIVSTEDKSGGQVLTKAVFELYVKSAGGTWFLWITLFCTIGLISSQLSYSWYLQRQTSANLSPENTIQFGLTLFGFLVGIALCLVIRNSTYLASNLIRSRVVGFSMSFKVLHSSINEFLDRIPIGRMLNRFMRDMGIVDFDLGYLVHWWIWCLGSMIGDIIIAIFASSPLMIVFIFAHVYITINLQQKYMQANREIVRLKSISSSPVIQLISEAASGASTLRIFQRGDWSLSKYFKALDEFQQNCVVGEGLTGWFMIRVYITSGLILVPSILLNLFWIQTGPGLFALLMKYLMMIVGDINEVLMQLSENEARLISLERCAFFSEIPSESGYKDLELTHTEIFAGHHVKVNPDRVWPQNGEIEIKGLKVSYRQKLPQVLKGLSLRIPSGTKVGVVGRTGAGKSTLLNCLYRYFDEYEGDVVLAGRELRTVDLKVLRSSMTILPQDPYLFADSVRNNLDPLGRHTDAAVEAILREVDLWDKMDSGLATQIDSAGSNLSQGEKQLLCLARALLQDNHVVLMDEATANIDSQSEQTIQRLLRDRFSKATIFMIAHRLNTVLQCDRILVLDGGKVLEYDTLEALKNNPNSRFSKLINDHEEMHNSLK